MAAASSSLTVEHHQRMVRWLMIASMVSLIFVGILAYLLVPNPPDPNTIDSGQAAQTTHR